MAAPAAAGPARSCECLSESCEYLRSCHTPLLVGPHVAQLHHPLRTPLAAHRGYYRHARPVGMAQRRLRATQAHILLHYELARQAKVAGEGQRVGVILE